LRLAGPGATTTVEIPDPTDGNQGLCHPSGAASWPHCPRWIHRSRVDRRPAWGRGVRDPSAHTLPPAACEPLTTPGWRRQLAPATRDPRSAESPCLGDRSLAFSRDGVHTDENERPARLWWGIAGFVGRRSGCESRGGRFRGRSLRAV